MNKQRGYVAIELDKPRHLKLDLNSMAILEEDHDTSVIDLLRQVEQQKVGKLRLLLWAALIHEDVDLTLNDVGEMVDFENMNYVLGKLTECVNKSDATKKKETGKK